MKDPFCDIDKAFLPLEEPLTWIQDKPPHGKATVFGTVLQGAMETQSAGVIAAPLTADSWAVRLSPKSLAVEKMSIGDTIERGCWKTQVLTVQQVYQDATGDFWLLCVAEQRAPLG